MLIRRERLWSKLQKFSTKLQKFCADTLLVFLTRGIFEKAWEVHITEAPGRTSKGTPTQTSSLHFSIMFLKCLCTQSGNHIESISGIYHRDIQSTVHLAKDKTSIWLEPPSTSQLLSPQIDCNRYAFDTQNLTTLSVRLVFYPPLWQLWSATAVADRVLYLFKKVA